MMTARQIEARRAAVISAALVVVEAADYAGVGYVDMFGETVTDATVDCRVTAAAENLLEIIAADPEEQAARWNHATADTAAADHAGNSVL